MRRICSPIALIVLMAFMHFVPKCHAMDYGKVTGHKVAEGVYLFTTTPYADVGLSGNSVAILSDDGVLVFDSNATPQTAATVLAEIRKLTDKPVRYLVNSHWHWDHWGGNETYLAAFPGLQIITHEKTRELMLTVEPRWNDKGLKQDLPQFLDGFEKQIAAAKAKNASQERIKAAEERRAADRNFLAQKLALHKTYPNVTFSDSMTIFMGGREIQVLHAQAITTGDTYLYLPKEKSAGNRRHPAESLSIRHRWYVSSRVAQYIAKVRGACAQTNHPRSRRCRDQHGLSPRQHRAVPGRNPSGESRQGERHDCGTDR